MKDKINKHGSNMTWKASTSYERKQSIITKMGKFE